MSREGESILLLDSDGHTRWTLKALLESEGYSVNAVDTVERALESFSPNISAFITEYWVDQSNTLGAIRELKKRTPEVYVMMVTDNVVNENGYEEVIHAGVDDYFVKPVPSQRILLHLSKGLRLRNQVLRKDQRKPGGRQTRTQQIKIPATAGAVMSAKPPTNDRELT